MNTFKPLVLASLTASLTACANLAGLMGGNKAPADSGVAAGAATTPAATPAAADYKPPKSEVVVDVGRPKHLTDSTVLIVPTAYVRLPVAGKVSVAQQGSALATIGGGNANTVKASAEFSVAGLDKALAQRIAKDVYDDFVAQLRAAGYTVLTYDDIKNRDFVKDADRLKPDAAWGMPTEKIWGGGTTALVATPSDEQAFEGGMAGGVFAEFMRFGKTKFEDGILIMPQFMFTAPQMWGEKGGGYSTISAAVKGAPAMEMIYASAPWLTNKPKVEMGGGVGPGVHLKGVTALSSKVGELKMIADTTSEGANAFATALSMLTGAGNIQSKSAKYEMAIDREAYVAAALAGARKFNAEVAKVAAEQKPKS